MEILATIEWSRTFTDYMTVIVVQIHQNNNSRWFVMPATHTDQFSNSYFVKTIVQWNTLSEPLVRDGTINKFNRHSCGLYIQRTHSDIDYSQNWLLMSYNNYNFFLHIQMSWGELNTNAEKQKYCGGKRSWLFIGSYSECNAVNKLLISTNTYFPCAKIRDCFK